MKFMPPLPFSVPLEDAAEVRSKLATPVETLMAEQGRAEIIQALPYIRWQMIFLLLEYGFTDEEIAAGMRINTKSVRNVKYFIRFKLKKQG